MTTIDELKDREAKLNSDERAARNLEAKLKKDLDPTGDLHILAASGDAAAVLERDGTISALEKVRGQLGVIGDELRTARRDRQLAEDEARRAEQADVESRAALAAQVVAERRRMLFEGGAMFIPAPAATYERGGLAPMVALARSVQDALEGQYGDMGRAWDPTLGDEFGIRPAGPLDFDGNGQPIEQGTIVAGRSGTGEQMEPDDPTSGFGTPPTGAEGLVV